MSDCWPRHDIYFSQPHGRAWKIHNKELLLQEIVPKFFGQSKYESFTRQLNGWGFKRLHQSGNDFNAYYHECFLRGMPHLTVLLKRVAPNQGKLLPHVEGEPNFYEIEKRFPLPPNIIPHPSYDGHLTYPPAAAAGAGCGALPKSHKSSLELYLDTAYPPQPALCDQIGGFPPSPYYCYSTHHGYFSYEQYPRHPFYPSQFHGTPYRRGEATQSSFASVENEKE